MKPIQLLIAAAVLLATLPACESISKQDAGLIALDTARVALTVAQAQLSQEAARPNADPAKLAAAAMAVDIAQRALTRVEARLNAAPPPVILPGGGGKEVLPITLAASM